MLLVGIVSLADGNLSLLKYRVRREGWINTINTWLVRKEEDRAGFMSDYLILNILMLYLFIFLLRRELFKYALLNFLFSGSCQVTTLYFFFDTSYEYS